MKRETFKQIIKLRSLFWKNERKGDYKMPNGKMFSDYIEKLVRSQMEIDNLAILSDGDLCICDFPIHFTVNEFYMLFPTFGYNEYCPVPEMDLRIKTLVNEIIG